MCNLKKNKTAVVFDNCFIFSIIRCKRDYFKIFVICYISFPGKKKNAGIIFILLLHSSHRRLLNVLSLSSQLANDSEEK